VTEPDGSRYRKRSDVDAIVYDLDGTLVELLVDWDAVAADATEVFADAGVDVAGVDLWEMLDRAADAGVADDLEAVIAGHEHEGARTSERLPAADVLPEIDLPVGVCSLNCESACRIALETHDLTDYVDVVVGRDSVATRKPDPEPLLAAVRALSASPERTLFVGDSERDAITAERAGAAFEYV
jgi:phosphoglycolate phosphatase